MAKENRTYNWPKTNTTYEAIIPKLVAEYDKCQSCVTIYAPKDILKIPIYHATSDHLLSLAKRYPLPHIP
jgi:hypothetical protein